MLLAGELIHVKDCSPYIRGQSICLIGWHCLCVSVCMCFFFFSDRFGRSVYALVKIFWEKKT